MRTFIKYVIGFSPILMTSVSIAECPSWISNQAEMPVCPDGKILSETYPTGALVVSDRGSLTSDSDYTAQVVTKAFAAQPEKSPLVVLPVADATMDKIKSSIDAMSATPEQKKRWKSQLVQVKVPSYRWQQDYFESFVNPATGMPEVREVQGYNGGEMAASFKEVAAALNKCGVRTGDALKSKDALTKGAVSGTYGGNIEALPGGICLLGDDGFASQQDWSDYADQFCGKDKRIQVPTYFLNVGHSDEVVKVLPNNNPAPCNFSVSVASPEKALELLKANSKGKLLTETKSTIMNFRVGRSRSMTGTNALTMLCRMVKGNRAVPDRSESGDGISFFEWLVQPSIAHADEEECGKITNAQTYNAVTKDKDVLAFNRGVQKEMDKLKGDIQQQISKQLPQCKVDFIDVPNLFFGGAAVEGGAGRKLTAGMGDSLLPNPTNSMSVGGTIVTPDPMNESFKKYIEQEYKKRGIKSEFVNTYDYAHIVGGNLHCTTHTVHVCKGRGK